MLPFWLYADLKKFHAQSEFFVDLFGNPRPACTIEQQLQNAMRYRTTPDLIEYLSVLSEAENGVIYRGLRNGFYNSYLMQLPDDRFSRWEWSRALSLAFHKFLLFRTVPEAKSWLNKQIPHYLRRGPKKLRAP